jgi:hypothetical protein
MKHRIVTLSVATLVLCAGQALAQDKPVVPPDVQKKAEEVIKQKQEEAKQKGQQIEDAARKEREAMEAKMREKGVQPEQKTPEAPIQPISGPPGAITFDQLKVDFGAISDDNAVNHTFKFTNTGTGTLQFTAQPRGSCSCTVPQLEKMTYAPGEAGEIKMSFNPKGKPAGKSNTTVTVQTNDPSNPNITLEVETTIKPILRTDPTMVQAGSLQRGQAFPQKVAVLSRKADLTVMSVNPSSPRIVAKQLPTVEVEEAGEKLYKTEIELAIADAATSGPIQENLSIRTSDAARFLSVFISGEIIGLIKPTPNQLNLPMLAPNQALTPKVRLEPKGGKAFKILKVEDQPSSGMGGNFKFEMKEDTSSTPSSWDVTGTGAAPGQPGRMSGVWVITTDLAEEPVIRINYSGFVNAPKTQPVQQDPAWQNNPSSLVPPGTN